MWNSDETKSESEEGREQGDQEDEPVRHEQHPEHLAQLEQVLAEAPGAVTQHVLVDNQHDGAGRVSLLSLITYFSDQSESRVDKINVSVIVITPIKFTI